jgi:predicted RNA methylase
MPADSHHVLDLCAGTGSLSAAAIQLGHFTLAIDKDVTQLAYLDSSLQAIHMQPAAHE